MSASTESQASGPTRERYFHEGMKVILEKLWDDPKSITAADAQNLADNSEARDVQMAQVVAAVKHIASFNEFRKSSANEDAFTRSSMPNAKEFPDTVITKLLNDPTSISTEDARRFSENIEARDARSARLVSAVESLAAVREDLRGTDAPLGQTPHPSMLTIVRDLLADVKNYPQDVDEEILKTTRAIANKMQSALSHRNAPHPELEAELQQEYAQIQPEIERGTVSSAEAGHLHSLAIRTHGHTEKGSLTAIAQSAAAKSEHQLSSSNDSGFGLSHATNRSSHSQTERCPQNEEISASEVIMVKMKPGHTKTNSSPSRSRRNQSLTAQTNTPRSHAEGHAQFSSATKGSPIRNAEKDTDGGSLSSLASSENVSRHRREKSQV